MLFLQYFYRQFLRTHSCDDVFDSLSNDEAPENLRSTFSVFTMTFISSYCFQNLRHLIFLSKFMRFLLFLKPFLRVFNLHPLILFDLLFTSEFLYSSKAIKVICFFNFSSYILDQIIFPTLYLIFYCFSNHHCYFFLLFDLLPVFFIGSSCGFFRYSSSYLYSKFVLCLLSLIND